MHKLLSTICLLVAVAGCATQQSTTAFRELSESEKAALHRSLPANLGGPAATQFRWGPVVASTQKGAHVGYCAEIDARNPDGSRSGYRRFFALLIPDGTGALTSGTIQGVAANSSAGDPAATQRVLSSCRHWGYRA
jgi:hypothetical protein